jgi:hypothetical protein
MTTQDDSEIVVRGVQLEPHDFAPVPLGFGRWAMLRRVGVAMPWAGCGALVVTLASRGGLDGLFSGLGILTATFLLAAVAGPLARRAEMAASAAAAQAQAPFDVIVGAEGITWRPPGGQLVWRWEALAVCAEDRSRFLYGTSPLSVGVIPKRCMSAEQIADLRERFARRRAEAR